MYKLTILLYAKNKSIATSPNTVQLPWNRPGVPDKGVMLLIVGVLKPFACKILIAMSASILTSILILISQFCFLYQFYFNITHNLTVKIVFHIENKVWDIFCFFSRSFLYPLKIDWNFIIFVVWDLKSQSCLCKQYKRNHSNNPPVKSFRSG